MMIETENAQQISTSQARPANFVFIIGAMKCGTTSLFEILSQHYQICASKAKEPDYFTEDKNDEALDKYLALWNWKQNTHSIALESSVAYSKAPYISGVPERIDKAKLGQHKFIYILRHPLSRIESQIRHGLFAGWGKSLDDGIPDDAINFSRYAMQLEEYLSYFSRDSIMLVTLEEFMSNPNEVLVRMCQFLSIDDNFQFTEVTKTRNSGDFFNATANLSKVTQSGIGQFIAQKLLPAKAKNMIRNMIAGSNRNSKPRSDLGRWKLTPEEKETALKLLAEDLIKLEADYDIDIQKHWQISSNALMQNDN